jgi:hypothetical protein
MHFPHLYSGRFVISESMIKIILSDCHLRHLDATRIISSSHVLQVIDQHNICCHCHKGIDVKARRPASGTNCKPRLRAQVVDEAIKELRNRAFLGVIITVTRNKPSACAWNFEVEWPGSAPAKGAPLKIMVGAGIPASQ